MVVTTRAVRGRAALVTRRELVGGMAGMLIGAAGSSVPAAALSGGPPNFENVRHQFTILRPANAAPSVRLTRLDGVVKDFAAFRSKVVLVNFCASWCPACKAELSTLDWLQETVGRRNLQVLAVSLDRGGRAVVRSFLNQLNLRHLDIYLDPQGRIARQGDDENDDVPFPLYGMPISYVVGSSGQVEGDIVGESDWSSDGARNLLNYYSRAAQD